MERLQTLKGKVEEQQPELDEVKAGGSVVLKAGPALWTTAVSAGGDSSPWSFSCGNEGAFHGVSGVLLEPSHDGEKHF